MESTVSIDTDNITNKLLARAAERNKRPKAVPLNKEDFAPTFQIPLQQIESSYVAKETEMKVKEEKKIEPYLDSAEFEASPTVLEDNEIEPLTMEKPPKEKLEDSPFKSPLDRESSYSVRISTEKSQSIANTKSSPTKPQYPLF